MSDERRIDFESWKTAAKGYDQVSADAPSSLSSVVSRTTDPGACSADGPSTVDAAVTLMLTAFGSVMEEGFIAPLREGLTSEADALLETGQDLRDAEDRNAALAAEIEGWY